MAEFIRGTSKQTYFMERELKSGGIAKFTKATGKQVYLMARVFADCPIHRNEGRCFGV